MSYKRKNRQRKVIWQNLPNGGKTLRAREARRVSQAYSLLLLSFVCLFVCFLETVHVLVAYLKGEDVEAFCVKRDGCVLQFFVIRYQKK